jgi:ABC-type dipeptide/oligopeptide/nickel transport system permease subunit
LKQILVVLEALITLILVLVAIVGIAYHSFREDGWVSQGFGKITDAYLNYPLIAIAVTIAAFFGYRAWNNRKKRGVRTKFFDYVIYAMMAVGIYFIGRYVVNGEL